MLLRTVGCYKYLGYPTSSSVTDTMKLPSVCTTAMNQPPRDCVAVDDYMVPYHDYMVPYHDYMVPYHDYMVPYHDYMVPFHDYMVPYHRRLSLFHKEKSAKWRIKVGMLADLKGYNVSFDMCTGKDADLDTLKNVGKVSSIVFKLSIFTERVPSYSLITYTPARTFCFCCDESTCLAVGQF